jgi:cysteine desulfurase / selenocysteine lyase
MLGACILDASLGLLLEYGLENVARNISNNISYLIENIEHIKGVKILSPVAEERRSGIFTFAAPVPPAALYSGLLDRRVISAARGGGIRFSPHFYNIETQMERALEVLKDLLLQS